MVLEIPDEISDELARGLATPAHAAPDPKSNLHLLAEFDGRASGCQDIYASSWRVPTRQIFCRKIPLVAVLLRTMLGHHVEGIQRPSPSG
jgi:hypothetical protein